MSYIKWNPNTGEHQVFTDEETAPADWLDHHPEDSAKGGEGLKAAKDDSPKEKPLDKAEVSAALTAGGIAFDPKSSAADLTALLDSKLRELFAGRGIAIAEDATTRQLLAQATA